MTDPTTTDDQPDPEFVKALENVGLLQDEYPDQMAERSCTCTPDAVCGAHRMLARYDQLFEAFRQSNREKRETKAEVRALRARGTASDDRLARIQAITDTLPLGQEATREIMGRALGQIIDVLMEHDVRPASDDRHTTALAVALQEAIDWAEDPIGGFTGEKTARWRAVLADVGRTGDDQP